MDEDEAPELPLDAREQALDAIAKSGAIGDRPRRLYKYENPEGAHHYLLVDDNGGCAFNSWEELIRFCFPLK